MVISLVNWSTTKMRDIVVCNECGWMHSMLTADQAVEQVSRFNEMYYKLPKEQQELYYGSKPATIENLLYCFNCGGYYTKFSDLKPGQAYGVYTVNPILHYNEHITLPDPKDRRLQEQLNIYAENAFKGVIEPFKESTPNKAIKMIRGLFNRVLKAIS